MAQHKHDPVAFSKMGELIKTALLEEKQEDHVKKDSEKIDPIWESPHPSHAGPRLSHSPLSQQHNSRDSIGEEELNQRASYSPSSPPHLPSISSSSSFSSLLSRVDSNFQGATEASRYPFDRFPIEHRLSDPKFKMEEFRPTKRSKPTSPDGSGSYPSTNYNGGMHPYPMVPVGSAIGSSSDQIMDKGSYYLNPLEDYNFENSRGGSFGPVPSIGSLEPWLMEGIQFKQEEGAHPYDIGHPHGPNSQQIGEEDSVTSTTTTTTAIIRRSRSSGLSKIDSQNLYEFLRGGPSGLTFDLENHSVPSLPKIPSLSLMDPNHNAGNPGMFGMPAMGWQGSFTNNSRPLNLSEPSTETSLITSLEKQNTRLTNARPPTLQKKLPTFTNHKLEGKVVPLASVNQNNSNNIFFFPEQPRDVQRKCYPSEKRYLLPNPFYIKQREFGTMPMLEGTVCLKIVDDSGRPLPDTEAEVVDGNVKELCNAQAKFSIRIFRETLGGERFRVQSTIRYKGGPNGMAEEVLLSDDFAVTTNNPKLSKESNPVMDGINPCWGKANQDNEVWIKGSNFGKKISVRFGGQKAKIKEISSQSNLICVIAPQLPNITEDTWVEVTVNKPGKSLQFLYYTDDFRRKDLARMFGQSTGRISQNT